MLTVAIGKGRICEQAIQQLASINIVPATPLTTRKLLIPTNNPNIQLSILRGKDVITYVDLGAVDVGLVGKDLIEESSNSNLLEVASIGPITCKMVCAGRMGSHRYTQSPNIATKFTNIARQYFGNKGLVANIIQLYGGMELAPNIGIADYIIDIVETGATLRANNLTVFDTLFEISTRVIVNPVSQIVKYDSIQPLLDTFINTAA